MPGVIKSVYKVTFSIPKDMAVNHEKYFVAVSVRELINSRELFADNKIIIHSIVRELSSVEIV